MKVLYLTNCPSPYKVDFFNELGKSVELTVLFEDTPNEKTGRKMSWFKTDFTNFEGIYLKHTLSKNGLCVLSLSVIDYIKKDFDAIIVGMYSTGTAMLAIKYMQLHHISYYISTDGGIPKNGTGLKEQLKKSLISNAIGYFSPSAASDEYLTTYGADSSKIYRYPFTTMWDKEILKQPVSFEEKKLLRKELGLPDQNIVLGVGQLIHRKGWDVLIRAAKGLHDCNIIIVGGSVTEEYSSLMESEEVKNVHFIDFMDKEKLKKYYIAADLFVLPTREDIWGLVINEAMAYGLPVISTNKCIAAVELIKNDLNGKIVSIEDSKMLELAISSILSNTNLLYTMSENSICTISRYSIEKMVESHFKVLKN